MSTRPPSKPDSDEGQRRLAVLIDADNAQPAVIEGLLAEIAKYGVASVKRIYGDFTSSRMTQWKQALLTSSINPVQQFAYTSGKNATDSTLIIDAMDLMYTRRFDGFCLVSSDSDFTRLAQRLREEGLLVYGFGERKTPDPFVQACDKFIYTEVLRAETLEPAATRPASPRKAAAKALIELQATKPPTSKSKVEKAPTTVIASGKKSAEPSPPAAAPAKPAGTPPLPIALIRRAIDESSDDQGWAHLSAVGSYLTKIRPDFDARLYGHRKLSDLLRHHATLFALEERSTPGSTVKLVYVRNLK